MSLAKKIIEMIGRHDVLFVVGENSTMFVGNVKVQQVKGRSAVAFHEGTLFVVSKGDAKLRVGGILVISKGGFKSRVGGVLVTITKNGVESEGSLLKIVAERL